LEVATVSSSTRSSPARYVPRVSPLKRVLLATLAAFFVGAGITHFTRPAFYTAMVPPYLPHPLALVYLSGAAEILLGTLVLLPATRVLAAWGLVLLLLAVFPANVHMAVNRLGFVDAPKWLPQPTPLGLWLRLPVQGLLIAWAWWYTRDGAVG
jgi:uncharacterized membrane protein